MSRQTKYLSLFVLAGICGAALLAWAVSVNRGASVVLAQAGTWATPEAQRLGVRLVETRDPNGAAAYTAQPGDLLFFTNAGTGYAAPNPKNSVVVINAKTRKPIAVSDIDAAYSEKLSSHGIGLSPDAKYTYLPSMTSIGAAEGSTREYTLVLDTRTLKLYQVLATGGTPHHAKAFRDGTGRQLVLIEHFNWNTANSAGKGWFVVDPKDNNKVVAGMLTGDLHGNCYSGFTTPDGKYLYCTVPPPNRNELGRDIDGWLAKIDTSTWKTVQSIPMHHYPLWTVFSLDGKWAWVTNSEDNSVLKVQRGLGPRDRDKVVAEVKTGGGPYGMRLTLDGRELWVADKGEGGPAGKTITIIDTEKDSVIGTVQTDCLRNDHIILSPDGSEMWATCNESHDIVVLDSKTHTIKSRIPMPNGGDSHGGVFVAYSRNGNAVGGEVVSDQNGLLGSALDAAMKGTPWAPPAAR
ncbi:MAG TPA: YncE family protein [Vicinamibacterales bacterium]|jgi:DNA-binding beta-propeller fold protein YncE